MSEFIFIEIVLLIILNLLIFIQTDSIVKTFVSLFQMFPILLILTMTKIIISNTILATVYLSTFIILNLLLVIMILFFIKKSLMIKKTDRNFRPDDYDE
ncbi:MAG: hypothetical protein WHT27_01150 [candidate division WOR-3 bacterium]